MSKVVKPYNYGKSKNIKHWVYIIIIIVNIAIIFSVGAVYVSSDRSYNQKLYEENLRNVDNLNAASANAAYTYIDSMEIKINDLVSYIEYMGLNYYQAIKYLDESNTNLDRQMQLVLSGSYRETNQLSFGGYSGVSVRKVLNKNGKLVVRKTDIEYDSSYYDMFSVFTDATDKGRNGLRFTQEFTDPDTKEKCFATYRHIDLFDESGQKRLYTLLIVINSKTALNSYNMQSEYGGQSAVLIDEVGNYVLKNSDYRNANFFDYIVNYNGLSLDKKTKLLEQVKEEATEGNSANLLYKNHRGEDCVFSVNRIQTGWYSITCVPISSFNLKGNTINYSLIILILFLVLFAIDGIAIYFAGKILRYNVNVAEQATESANSANEAKSRFLSTMSHELRTPLNAITGLVALSKDSLEDRAVLENYLLKIDISSKLLLQLISDILDISAIESNKMRLSSSKFDVAKLITSLSAIYYDQCTLKGIEFEVALKNIRSTTLIGDSVRLNQILLNFLSNAVKFTPNGGHIILRAEEMETKEQSAVIRFEIEDTGCGISDEMRERLFSPFEHSEGDEKQKYSGSGLGLSIAKNLVGLMGGEVGYDSKEGEGSCFWAQIPFVVPADVNVTTFNPIGNMRVLAVISKEDELEYIGHLLDRFGVEYLLTGDVDKALSIAKEHISNNKPFNLFILDWKQRDLNTFDASKKIKNTLGKQSPRIMVLAYDIANANALCSDDGVDIIFGKPVFPSTLYNTLMEMSGNSEIVVERASKSVDLTGKRILLVEDNELNTEIASLLLMKIGLEVETAVNGLIGKDMFIKSTPGYYDAILMDIQMPVMNGYESTIAIRESGHADAKSVPIFAMTADAFAEDMQKAKVTGMNEHIAKPVVPETLYKILNMYIGG